MNPTYLRRHLTHDGHITLGHGNIVMRFKRGDDSWTPEALERSHEELHASVAQRHTHKEACRYCVDNLGKRRFAHSPYGACAGGD